VEGAAAEEVEMQVENLLAGVAVAVDYGTISAFVEF